MRGHFLRQYQRATIHKIPNRKMWEDVERRRQIMTDPHDLDHKKLLRQTPFSKGEIYDLEDYRNRWG